MRMKAAVLAQPNTAFRIGWTRFTKLSPIC